MRLLFIGKYQGGEVKLNPNEHQEWRWIKPNEINSIKAVHYLPDMLNLLLSKKHQLLVLKLDFE